MRISDLAEATGEDPRTLRFYERAGVLPAPPRTTGRYRDYGPAAIGRVARIRALQSAGLTLDEIARVTAIAEGRCRPGSDDQTIVPATLERIDRRIDLLRRVRDDLSALAAPVGAYASDAGGR